MFNKVQWLYITLFCSKQLPWNLSLNLLSYSNKGLRMLLNVAGSLMLSSKSPLDFHSRT